MYWLSSFHFGHIAMVFLSDVLLLALFMFDMRGLFAISESIGFIVRKNDTSRTLWEKKLIDPNENCLVDIHGLFEV